MSDVMEDSVLSSLLRGRLPVPATGCVACGANSGSVCAGTASSPNPVLLSMLATLLSISSVTALTSPGTALLADLLGSLPPPRRIHVAG